MRAAASSDYEHDGPWSGSCSARHSRTRTPRPCFPMAAGPGSRDCGSRHARRRSASERPHDATVRSKPSVAAVAVKFGRESEGRRRCAAQPAPADQRSAVVRACAIQRRRRCPSKRASGRANGLGAVAGCRRLSAGRKQWRRAGSRLASAIRSLSTRVLALREPASSRSTRARGSSLHCCPRGSTLMKSWIRSQTTRYEAKPRRRELALAQREALLPMITPVAGTSHAAAAASSWLVSPVGRCRAERRTPRRFSIPGS